MSNECLVTLILKMDLGGWLSTRSPLACLLGPIAGQFLSESGASSVIALRDKVRKGVLCPNLLPHELCIALVVSGSFTYC